MYTAEFSGKLEEDAACVQFGQRVLEWVETASFPLRAVLLPKDEYLPRGTSHLLASEDLTAGYWHPKLLHKLDESLPWPWLTLRQLAAPAARATPCYVTRPTAQQATTTSASLPAHAPAGRNRYVCVEFLRAAAS